MYKLNFLLYLSLFTLVSCSSLNKSIPNNRRDLSSITKFVKSCSDAVKGLIYKREVDFKTILMKIEGHEKLTFSEKKALSAYFSNIPEEQSRNQFAKHIKSNKPLNHKNKLLLKRYIEPHIYKDQLASKWTYRKRYLGGDPEIPITFGLEVELLLKDNPNLINFYKLDSFSDEEWLGLTQAKRLELAQSAVDNAQAYETIFQKLSSAHMSLPEGLFIEGHKTIEANNIIFDNIGDTEDFLKWFSENIGRGSFQGHVVYKNYVKVKGVAGNIIFESDLAQLDNLERGYSRFLLDPKITPSNNLIHHSLGPLSDDERLLFLIYEDSINSKTEIKEPIGKSKTILGPNFRVGNPYPEGMVGFEHRQYHKRFESLLEGLDYQSRELEVHSGLDRYKDFDNLTQIDESLLKSKLDEFNISYDVDDIELFFIAAGEIIENHARSFGMSLGGASGAHRFYFPLKNWSDYPLLSELDDDIANDLIKKINRATKDYLNEVIELVKKTDLDDINSQILRELQILNARWGHEISLSQHFSKYRKVVLNEISARGPPEYHTTPKLSFVKPSHNILNKNGRKTNVFKINSNVAETDGYQQIKEESAEIIYEPIGKFGHISLRVGDKVYSFENYRQTSKKIFNLSKLRKNAKGFVFNISKEQIQKMEDQISHVYRSGQKYNIPPFDAYSRRYEIIMKSNGNYIGKQVDSSKSGSSINLQGEVKEIAGKKYLVAPNNVKLPIEEKDGRMYIKSVNCASSASTILRQFLGIDIGNFLGAHSINDAVMDGLINKVPDFIFDYSK
jgi:hypothetical protein